MHLSLWNALKWWWYQPAKGGDYMIIPPGYQYEKTVVKYPSTTGTMDPLSQFGSVGIVWIKKEIE